MVVQWAQAIEPPDNQGNFMSITLILNPHPSELLPDGVVFERKFRQGGFLFRQRRTVVKGKRKYKLIERFHLLRTFWSNRFKLPDRMYQLAFKSPDGCIKMIHHPMDVVLDMQGRAAGKPDEMKGWMCDESTEEQMTEWPL